jgi:hypothetical protein
VYDAAWNQNGSVWIPGDRSGGADFTAESAIDRERGGTKFTVIAGTTAGGAKAISLLSGTSIDISPDWIEREQMSLPPSPRLARFAPQLTFLEFAALENPKMHLVLQIATTTNPFLGGDEVALDVQMHSAAGSGSGLADYLFYFFFSPPRDCLDGGLPNW